MKAIVYKILWSTIEDFLGLWEILWELNSELPQKRQDGNLENAKAIAKYFLEQNLVIFYFNKWGSDDLKELEFEEALNILEERRYWDAPQIDELCIKIGSTEKGEKYYNEELLSNFI